MSVTSNSSDHPEDGQPQRTRWSSICNTPSFRWGGSSVTSSPAVTPMLSAAVGPSAARRGVAPGGSVTGGPWQLVEVPSGGAASHATPHRSPQIAKPPVEPSLHEELLPPPALEADERWSEDHNTASYGDSAWQGGANWWSQPRRRERRRSGGRRRRNDWWEHEKSNKAEEEAEEEELDENGFNPLSFVGEWLDNLGHTILVVSVAAMRSSGRNGAKSRHAYHATLHKPGVPDKVFNISRDRGKKDWTCGNGTLDRQETTIDVIVWRAGDGRASSWRRKPPEGPVYFDAPPASETDEWSVPPWVMPPVIDGLDQGYMLPSQDDSAGNGAGDIDGNSSWFANLADAASGSSASGYFNASAPEFVPSATQASDLGDSVHSLAALVTTPEASTVPEAAPQRPWIQLSEVTDDVKVVGHRLEWCLPDSWGKLSRFPKDFCITSPKFGVRQATSMQLMFYPNGSKAAEADHCTLALTRQLDQDSAGIKFEFTVGGRGSGPKVCLGRRYLGDYPKPFDETDENKSQRVVIVMQILEVFGGAP